MYNKVNVIRHQEERECPNCGKVWKIWCKKDSVISDRFRYFCDDCNKLLTTWEKKLIKRKKFPEVEQKYKEMKRREFINHYIKNLLSRTKKRAFQKGLEFNISEEDIVIPELCPILEVPLVIGTSSNYEYSPSIDRIDNTKGYIKGNIQIISKKANSMKNSATLEELKTFCKNILRYSLTTIENECSEFQDKEPERQHK